MAHTKHRARRREGSGAAGEAWGASLRSPREPPASSAGRLRPPLTASNSRRHRHPRPLRLLILGPGRTRTGDEGAGNGNVLAPPLLEKERDSRTQTPARQACGFLRDGLTGNYVLPKEIVF